jgi:hypothetical protein
MRGKPQPYDPLVPTPRPRRRAKADGLVAGLASVAAHAALLLALLAVRVEPPETIEPEAINVALLQPPPPPLPPEEPKAPGPAGDPAPAKAATPKRPVRPPRLVPPAAVEPLPATPAPKPTVVAELGEADLAGAATAGTGAGAGGSGSGTGGGGDCDMVRLLQDALRKNPRVRAALAQAHPDAAAAGKAVLVWNGDWVQSPGQEGKGLAGVRELIMLEVAFAPAACRADAMRGLVLISLTDGPGAPRLALGSSRWRWSDLLFAKSGRARG